MEKAREIKVKADEEAAAAAKAEAEEVGGRCAGDNPADC